VPESTQDRGRLKRLSQTTDNRFAPGSVSVLDRNPPNIPEIPRAVSFIIGLGVDNFIGRLQVTAAFLDSQSGAANVDFMRRADVREKGRSSPFRGEDGKVCNRRNPAVGRAPGE
jgi:hypothetical protein